MTSITTSNYSTFEQAYDFFNAQLFSGKLPMCMITFQRKANSYGYFANDRFTQRTSDDPGTIHEIALNPAGFQGRSDKEILSTLVHEMTHLWQMVFGKPGKGAYHNKEWANKMLEIGLTPISIDNPGKMIGQKVTHEINVDGLFYKACTYLPPDFCLEYESIPEPKKAKAKRASKTKFTCPCGSNIWGKPDTSAIHADCGETYEPEI